MDIHKPKPIHSWREFLKEYAIIVLGVATALAAEQAVVTLHDRAKAAEARAGIHAEIAFNLAEMNARQALEPCVIKRLGEVDALIAAASAGKLPPEPILVGATGLRTMQDAKYKAALQSGAVSLFGDNEQATYSDLYSKFEIFNRERLTERTGWWELRTLETHPPPTAALDAMWRSALQRARASRALLNITRSAALTDASGIGVAPEPRKLQPVQPICLPLHTSRDGALKQLPNSFGTYFQ
ncbi:MAG: hypothetical protein JO256_05205 [Alphaproteobacteria bacterium]|nr:hypothetical protein [Alphaproteobacteria bacterium]